MRWLIGIIRRSAAWAQHARKVEQLLERFPDAAAMLADAVPEVLAFATFPKEHWRQIGTVAEAVS